MKQYGLILADPPWRYDFSKSKSRAIENQYQTMSLEDICRLPVADLAKPQAVLFLWATAPKLPEALQVMAAWGFTYKSCDVWQKNGLGMGYYTRVRHELLLIGVRGGSLTPLPCNRPPSVFFAERGKHSAKPDRAYERIEKMYPSLSKVELFARRKRPGWDVWGNELPNDVELATT